MKNYLGQTLGLTVLVVALLFALSLWRTPGQALGLALKPMDIFAAVRRDVPATPESLPYLPAAGDTAWIGDSTLMPPEVSDTVAGDALFAVAPPVDTGYFGRIIEDYTPDRLGLAAFFSVIDSIGSHQRSVRIAFFGDSFVEGDLVLGDLRDTLQGIWGGQGVGFLPITEVSPGFRRTGNMQFDGWKTYSIVQKEPARMPFGINGYVYVPSGEATFHFAGSKWYRNTRQWSTVRLLYQTPAQRQVYYRTNGAAEYSLPLPGTGGRVGQALLQQPGMYDVRLRFPETDSLWVYGISLEDGPGIYVDNFSVRGNSGIGLRRISVETARRFDALLHYDLVIVQFGLNAATAYWTPAKLEWYRKELQRTYAHLRACFPGRPIMVFSIGDRAGKVNGELMTMPSVISIAGMQRDLARENGFLYFDLFHAMGGPGAMVRLAAMEPPEASKDFTHLSHAGGRRVGRRIAQVLIETYQQYRTQ